jgi:WD40 repeat protein
VCGVEGDKSPLDVHLWNLTTGKLVQTWPRTPGGFGSDPVAFAPDGKTLAIAYPDRTVKLWPANDPGAAKKK